MQWAEDGMLATELEVQQLTSTDIQDNVARTAAKPSSKASKADTPVHVFHPLLIKDIPVNGSTMCECDIRTRNCRTHGSKYFCRHDRKKHRCKECGMTLGCARIPKIIPMQDQGGLRGPCVG